MAMEEADGLEIGPSLAALGRWFWLVLLGAALAAGGGYTASRLTPPTYEASTTILVEQGQTTGGVDSPASSVEGLVATFAEMVKARSFLGETASRLQLSGEDADLGECIRVEVVHDTQLMRVSVRHHDRALAANIANTVPQVLIEQNGQRVSSQLARSQASLEREMLVLQERIASTQRSLDAERAAQAPDEGKITRFDALLAQYRTTYASLLKSLEETRVASAVGFATVNVIDPAVVPEVAVAPRTSTNTLLAGLLGAMLAAAAALWLDRRDDTLRDAADVEKAAHLPVLGSIVRSPRSAAGEPGRLAAIHGPSVVVEGYRMLRASLQFASAGVERSAAVLLVTSAHPLEGKTTTLANLGASLAQAGKQVVLVDSDLRQPALHEQFGVRPKRGLVALLEKQETDLQRAIHDTPLPGLRLLPAGQVHPHAAEALSQPEMAAIVSELRQMADYVLLDSPPVLGVADASILAQQADGVLLVVKMGRTRRAAVREAVARLERFRVPILGTVLNNVRPHGSQDGHGLAVAGRRGAGQRRRQPRLLGISLSAPLRKGDDRPPHRKRAASARRHAP